VDRHFSKPGRATATGLWKLKLVDELARCTKTPQRGLLKVRLALASSADSMDGVRGITGSVFFVLGFLPLIGSLAVILFAHTQKRQGTNLNRRAGSDVYPVKWTEAVIARQVSILKWGVPSWVLIAFSLVMREDFFHVVEFLSMIGWVCWAYMWQVSWVEKRERGEPNNTLRRVYNLSQYAALAGTILYVLRWLVALNLE